MGWDLKKLGFGSCSAHWDDTNCSGFTFNGASPQHRGMLNLLVTRKTVL